MPRVSGRTGGRVIRAKLESGETVVLEKDCGCCDEIHIGPHWLHMNDFDRAVNEEQLKAADKSHNSALFLHGAQAEVRRLADKERQMRQRGIVEIIRPDR